MKWRAGLLAAALFGVFLVATTGETYAQDCPTISSSRRAALIREHVYGGRPAPGTVLVRRAYVTQYDAEHRVPRWSAWRAALEYLDPPDREGRWAQFRTDRRVADPVVDSDYRGVGEVDMARGHIVPYFISGGDRDHDGLKADDDLDDACTVYEVNYLSNVAPQFQSAFNGSGGLWYELETKIREDIVGSGAPIHIIAGTVFGEAEVITAGDGDIPVPHMFFQILITPSGVAPFLFEHTARIGDHGCALDADLEDCIVAIVDIEAVTGLDFFARFDDAFEAVLQTPDGRAVWQALLGE